MLSAAAVVVCALALLGRSADRTPPIEVLADRPPEATNTAEAFASRETGKIYLIASSLVFRDAQRRDREALVKIASIIAHEMWHLEHGADESGAYQAQLGTLIMLGHGPGRPLYSAVTRSMQHVLSAHQRAKRVTVLAAASMPAAAPGAALRWRNAPDASVHALPWWRTFQAEGPSN